jgi:asparagine synthase (glutamine-hydrolysing)
MCGMCGIYEYGRASGGVTADVVSAMRDTMVHRGPDDAGTWISADRRVGLGHRRLSIVDLSAAGHNPMTNETGDVWIVFNGEIYNHAKIRSWLVERGHTYRSRTDTETLIHLYEEVGDDLVDHLEGMFAFAIWDARRNRLLLARDRLGVKPLYYAMGGGRLLFGSEIKALLEHPEVSRDIDEESLYHYLTFLTTPAPRTLFAGISKLQPGHLLRCEADGTVEIHRYWDAIVENPDPPLSEADTIDRVRALLAEAVEKRTMADVPFGVFLSGGVDSSATLAFLARASNQPVRTFTVGFEGAPRYNELEHARRIARQYKADYHEVIIGPEDAVEFLPEMIYHQDEPIADPVCVSLYYVSKLARETGTIVVQAGEGADEIFSGYTSYATYLRAYELVWRHAERLPSALRGGAARLARSGLGKALIDRLPKGRKLAPELARRLGAGEPLFWSATEIYDETQKARLLSPSYRERVQGLTSFAAVQHHLEHLAEEKPSADFLERLIYCELKLRLAELLLMRVDKITMATSVETRVPFLDHKLVEFAMTIPRSMKIRNGENKWVLKKALEGIVPDDLLYRPKQGFALPINEWCIAGMAPFVERTLFSSPLRKRELFDYDVVREIWDAHRSGRGDYSFNIWSLLNLSLWYEHWIEGRPFGIGPAPEGGSRAESSSSTRSGSDGVDRER